jgi:hypothetical protein
MLQECALTFMLRTAHPRRQKKFTQTDGLLFHFGHDIPVHYKPTIGIRQPRQSAP